MSLWHRFGTRDFCKAPAKYVLPHEEEVSTRLDVEQRSSYLRAFGQGQCEDDRNKCEHENNGESVPPRLGHEIGGGCEEEEECNQDKEGHVTRQAGRVAAISTDRAIAHARGRLVEEAYSATLAVGAGEHGRRG